MKRPAIPYSLQVATSMLSGNKDHQHEVIGNAIASIAGEVSEFIQSYDMTDLPFVLAAMQIVTNGLMPVLGDGGKGIYDHLVNSTQIVTMDAATFNKLMGEEGKE